MKNRLMATQEPDAEIWRLSLYVLGQTVASMRALANLKLFCERYLKIRYHITVIDLAVHPELARADQIVCIPTVLRTEPKPQRMMLGNFSDIERVLDGLDLRGTN